MTSKQIRGPNSLTNKTGETTTLRDLKGNFQCVLFILVFTSTLQRISCPITCINSDRFVTYVEVARKYAPLFDAKIIENVGHAVMLDAPDEFNASLTVIVTSIKEKVRPMKQQTVDFSQAELMVDFFRNLAKGELHPEKVDEIMNSKGMELIVGQLNLARRATKGQYRKLLMGLLSDEMPHVPPADGSERARQGVRGLQQIWMLLRWGMNNEELLEERIDFLKRFEIFSQARQIAESNLPAPIETIPYLHIVAGGRAGAAAIGNHIYIDILNFTRSRSRPGRSHITETEVIEYFAHEMHHVEFSTIIEKKQRDLQLNERTNRAFGCLAGLVSEGSASYLINGHRDIESMRDNRNYRPYFAMGDTLLNLCENVLRSTLDGEIQNDEEYYRATRRLLGSGYHVTGSILLNVINEVNGIEPIMAIISDPRRLLLEYNRAGKDLISGGEPVHFFLITVVFSW